MDVDAWWPTRSMFVKGVSLRESAHVFNTTTRAGKTDDYNYSCWEGSPRLQKYLTRMRSMLSNKVRNTVVRRSVDVANLRDARTGWADTNSTNVMSLSPAE